MPEPKPSKPISAMSLTEKKYVASALLTAVSGLALTLSAALDPTGTAPGSAEYRARMSETFTEHADQLEALEREVKAERGRAAGAATAPSQAPAGAARTTSSSEPSGEQDEDGRPTDPSIRDTNGGAYHVTPFVGHGAGSSAAQERRLDDGETARPAQPDRVGGDPVAQEGDPPSAPAKRGMADRLPD